MTKIPFLKPKPPALADAVGRLRSIDESGVYTNFGPVNANFESSAVSTFFGGEGACLTICNATIGLMLSIKSCLKDRLVQPAYALMPSYTFAATAHAALWAGLTPLFCDVDPLTWFPDPEAEVRALRKYGSQIAVVVPYATFGGCIDLDRYASLRDEFGVPVVVDAAASLGSMNACGKGFGTGSDLLINFSMHATKTFSTSEGGLIYSANKALIEKLRVMSNFGFGLPRQATMPGLNGKMSEVAALIASLKLDGFDSIVARREELVDRYRRGLPRFEFQKGSGRVQAHQFCAALLPGELAGKTDHIIARCHNAGVSVASYFRPHLARQPYFAKMGASELLPVSDMLSDRNVSLPLFDDMSDEEVDHVCHVLNGIL